MKYFVLAVILALAMATSPSAFADPPSDLRVIMIDPEAGGI